MTSDSATSSPDRLCESAQGRTAPGEQQNDCVGRAQDQGPGAETETDAHDRRGDQAKLRPPDRAAQRKQARSRKPIQGKLAGTDVIAKLIQRPDTPAQSQPQPPEPTSITTRRPTDLLSWIQSIPSDSARQILSLRAWGWNIFEVADMVKCAPENVTQVCERWDPNGLARLTVEEQHAGLAGKWRRLADAALGSLTPEELAKCTPMQRSTIAAIASDKAVVLAPPAARISLNISATLHDLGGYGKIHNVDPLDVGKPSYREDTPPLAKEPVNIGDSAPTDSA